MKYVDLEGQERDALDIFRGLMNAIPLSAIVWLVLIGAALLVRFLFGG